LPNTQEQAVGNKYLQPDSVITAGESNACNSCRVHEEGIHIVVIIPTYGVDIPVIGKRIPHYPGCAEISGIAANDGSKIRG
jgi:hypothetical protein